MAIEVLAATMAGPLPLLVLLVALAGGITALAITTREEEPQVIVPLADALVSAPGLSAKQVERQIATPLEKLLSQIDEVECVYSLSQPERCVVTDRFFVGKDREDSLVKIYNKVFSQTNRIPAGVVSWVGKLIEIGDQIEVISGLTPGDEILIAPR